MRINELLQIRYHNTLNPKFWDDVILKDEVRDQLITISENFIDFLSVENLSVEDIVITGSNANYNWTEVSDIDLHIIIDMESFKMACPDLAAGFFNDKKTLWNTQNDVTIYDQQVEIYAQDASEEHIATGMYSILNNKWIITPEYSPPEYNDIAVEAKAEQLKYEIDLLLDANGDPEQVSNMKSKIRTMRQSGLQAGGEFSTENLAFKELRNSGYLGKLSRYSRMNMNKNLSL